MSMPRVAIVGVSGFGNVHYKDLSRAADAGLLRIAAATIINQSEEAEKVAALKARGTEIFDDAAKMFAACEGGIDITFLPVGIGLHAPLAIAAMKSGSNVYIEKPLAATVQEADEIINASDETGRFAIVGYQHICQPGILRIKHAISSGSLGKIKSVKAIGLWPRPHSYYARNSWAGRLKSNGGWILDSPANNALAHYLNIVLFFGGSSERETAEITWSQAALYRARNDIETFDTAFIKMKTRDGADLFFATSHAPEAQLDPIVEVEGEAGFARWTQREFWLKPAGAGAEEHVMNPPHEAERDNCVNTALARLADPSVFVYTPRHAKVLTQVVDAAHAFSPITQAPPDFIRAVAAKTDGSECADTRAAWKGLDALALRCFAESRLPNAGDIPFAASGGVSNPSAMARFEGVFTG